MAGTIHTVKTGTSAIATGFNYQRKLARKSNGDLWCVYYRSDGTYNQIYAAYSTDGGENWTEERVTTAGAHQYYPAIAIDSKDNVHVVWHGLGWGANTSDTNIQYRKRTTTWQAQEAVTDKDADQVRPSIAIDSDDNVHVVWYGQGWGANPFEFNIQYRKRVYVWHPQEAITDAGDLQYYPSIAIDSEDNVHVIWRGKGWGTNTANWNVQYRKRTTAWQTQEAVTDKDADQDYGSIAIDSDDNVHIIWDGKGWGTNTTNWNIQYRKRTTAWQTQESVTDKNASQYSASIAIDSDDNVHVVWQGLGWGTNTANINIQYRKRTTAWQTQEGITDRAYTNSYPNLIWALHPTVSRLKTNRPKAGYALVWSGQDASGYKVEFFKSTDLEWAVAALFGNPNVDQLIYQHAERLE